jgi:Zn-dependent protease with chaperone function
VSVVLQSAPFFALAAAAFMLIGSLGAGALRVFGRRALARLAPRARYRALFAVSALPLGAAVWLTAVASLPSLIALVDPSMDHCVSHGGEHAHLCFVHLPGTAMRGELVGLIVAAVAYMVCRSAGAGLGVLRASRVTRALVRTSQRDESGALVVVETARPICLTVGLMTPRVVVSRGLLAGLTPEEQAVALTHERAHAARRDALMRLVARATAALHLPGVGGWLLRELEVAAEQCCDEAAAAAAGDRLLVASTILKVERLVRASGTSEPAAFADVSVALGTCAVERRVEALLVAPRVEPSLRLAGALTVAALFTALVCADGVHHFAESALSRIAH